MLFTTMTKYDKYGVAEDVTAERKKGMAGKISIPQPYLVKKYNNGLGVMTNWIVLSLYCTE